jgi:hypothetical protein
VGSVELALSPAKASRLARELSAQVGERVGAEQIQAMARVAQTRDPGVLGFVEKFLTLAEGKTVRSGALVASLTEAMKLLARGHGTDPLSGVDGPLSSAEAARAVALAEAQATESRGVLLLDCVSADDAARLTRRSRQSLERFRRAGRVLALREGHQWRYPRWQFDPDAAGGILPGLDETLRALRLSPAGAGYWLTHRHERLKDSPIQLLRRGRVEPVVQAAREQGERP